MNICEACWKDFKQSQGALSKTGEELIAVGVAMGFRFNIVPPDKCEDSTHSQIMKEKEES